MDFEKYPKDTQVIVISVKNYPFKNNDLLKHFLLTKSQYRLASMNTVSRTPTEAGVNTVSGQAT